MRKETFTVRLRSEGTAVAARCLCLCLPRQEGRTGRSASCTPLLVSALTPTVDSSWTPPERCTELSMEAVRLASERRSKLHPPRPAVRLRQNPITSAGPPYTLQNRGARPRLTQAAIVAAWVRDGVRAHVGPGDHL